MDEPAFAYAFFGVLKIGAVAVPFNTLLKEHDYRTCFEDTRAGVLIVSAALLPGVERIAALGSEGACAMWSWSDRRSMPTPCRSTTVSPSGSPALTPSQRAETMPPSGCTRRGAPARPKDASTSTTTCGCARSCSAAVFLASRESDRTFSVAKLFFAYGLGNALYFPLAVGRHDDSLAGAADAGQASTT